jgi:hypothetical protein
MALVETNQIPTLLLGADSDCFNDAKTYLGNLNVGSIRTALLAEPANENLIRISCGRYWHFKFTKLKSL